MKQPRDQHWADLLTALEREADALRGHICGISARRFLAPPLSTGVPRPAGPRSGGSLAA